MTRLNLPDHPFNTKKEGQKMLIFDVYRKRFVTMTPEEEVRQHFLAYLVHHKNYTPGKIAVEAEIKMNNLSRRCDAIIYSSKGRPLLIAEFKAPDVKITQNTIDQISNYNMELKVSYLILSNGIKHYCVHIDNKTGQFKFLKDIPFYEQINSTEE